MNMVVKTVLGMLGVLLGMVVVMAGSSQPAPAGSGGRNFTSAMCVMGALSGDRALRDWCVEMQLRREERHHGRGEWRHRHHRNHFYAPQRECYYDRFGRLRFCD